MMLILKSKRLTEKLDFLYVVCYSIKNVAE